MKWREKKKERKKPGDNACRCQALVDGGDTRRLFGMLSVALVLVRTHSGIIHQPYSTSCHLQMLQSLKACTHRLIIEKKKTTKPAHGIDSYRQLDWRNKFSACASKGAPNFRQSNG